VSDPKIALNLKEMTAVAARFLPYARPYWKHFLAGVIATLILNAAGIVQPYILKTLTDRVLAEPGGDLTILHVALAALMGTAVIKGAFLYVQAYMMAWGNNATVKDIREDVYRHIQMLPLAWFDRARLGDLIVRLTDNIRIVTELLAAGIIALMNDVLIAVGAITYMLLQSPVMTVIAFSLTPVTVKLIGALEKRVERIAGSAQDNVADLSSQVQETLTGARVVKAFCREHYEVERYRVNSTATYNLALRMSSVILAQNPLVESVSTVSLVIVIGYGAYEVAHGKMTLGDFMAFWGYLLLASTPISRLTNTITNLRRGLFAAKMVFELKDIEPEVHDDPLAPPLPPAATSVEFDDVSFSYVAGQEALSQVSFSIPYGKTVAIVGHNGAGKSTLVSLLSRFYDPTQGRVLIDGIDVSSVRLNSLRRQISLVLQDNILFSGTIRDNIKYGRPKASDAEMIEAAKTANCHDLIMGFARQYDTPVTEGGRGLSGGQKQRIAIARAILSNPRILILDEATSSLDLESEHFVESALRQLMEGRSTFVIAHRLSTVRRADLILVMDKGRIAERGTHEELLRGSGIYRRIHNVFYSVDDTDLMTQAAS